MATSGEVDGTALEGVPATALWTLRNRAIESARSDSDFSDPLAEHLYRSISYPYEIFGEPSQSHARRAQTFDAAIRDKLAHSDNCTVVALGEGLQTSYWRLGRPDVPWLSVDLPEMIALREGLLPAEFWIHHVATSALDRSWFDLVTTTDVIITAEGLLFYLPRADVMALLGDLAKRFPGGSIVFDIIPPLLAWLSRKGAKPARNATFQLPPLPWAITAAQARRLPEKVPRLATYTELPTAPGRGFWWNPKFTQMIRKTPILGNQRHFIAELGFATH
ncbi:class I SAM-dependent methyltransferase [Nocardia iowensis]|uniref:Class I SAM-dependent methyltransferase n=1 Tax=Nocardia iowensis TaxID=204891 RepID=A0ABX8RIR8_NOCIO|nr:class I SAM-dependent methyltransferase [Nocardia iowensis]QXN88350.1 class I SAM-dependent methyltransferase [Nocardia iowensis]